MITTAQRTKVINNTSPSGRQGGALTLTRKISNRSLTLGELDLDGIVLHTAEGRMPLTEGKNVSRLLKPGVYLLDVQYAAVLIGDKIFHGFWPNFRRVPWFPKASFMTNSMDSACKGMIVVGTELVDEFHLGGMGEACKEILRWGKRYHDEYGNEPAQLRIVEERDTMEFHDYNEDQYYAMLREQEERSYQEEMEQELYHAKA